MLEHAAGQRDLRAVSVFSAAILLLLVIDPFGNIPFFVAALRGTRESRRRAVIARELILALLVLVGFLFLGQHLLALLQISESALTAAGGTVLLLIAIRMIFPAAKGTAPESAGEPFIVPLAIPYVAGPSAMAAVLLIMNREPARWPEWLAALVLAWAVSAVIIMLCGPIARILGEKGLTAIERLMGMLLVAIATQMLMNGIAQFVRSTAQGA